MTIDPGDLAFAHLCHHADPDGLARISVFFAARRWTGEPVNAEPGKCSEIAWHELSKLPGDIVSTIRTGLNAYDNGTAFRGLRTESVGAGGCDASGYPTRTAT